MFYDYMYVLHITCVFLCCVIQTDCQTVTLCSNPIKNGSCLITCDTPGTSQTVEFFLGPASQGSCIDFGGSPVCTVGLSQTGNVTTFTISSLSKTAHEGDWTCKYGASSSTPETLTVYTVPSVVNILQTIPEVNSTDATDEVKVSAECYCIYPTTSVVEIFNSKGTSGTSDKIATVGTGSIIENAGSPLCEPHEFKLEISNYTVQPNMDGSDVYIEIQFGSYKTAKYGPLNIKASPPTPDECQDPFWYGFLPVLIITLVGTLLVIAVSYRVGKESKLQEGSLKQSCGCCPSDNTCCMALCPLCTNPLCTSSTKTGLVVSTSVTNAAAIAIGLGLGFGLGSGQCILALILSIVCGLALVAIFTVSVYPHWPCLPEKGQDGRNCFNACRIVPKEETKKTDENDSGKKKPQKKTDENDSGKKKPQKKPEGNQASPNRETKRKTDENNSGKKNPKREPAENQDPPNRETPRSPQATASASGIQLMTAEGRSPRPLENPRIPAIVSEAKQPTPISNEESTLKKKPLNTALPETPNQNKLPPMEDKPKKRKKKKKKREGEENEEEDKRDSQNSGGQANVEEEE